MEAVAAHYMVWASDDVIYGPVELTELMAWAQDERVLPNTWVYCPDSENWSRAIELAELSGIFDDNPATAPAPHSPEAAPAPLPVNTVPAVRPGQLRRIKVLAELNDEQLTQFASFGELVRVPAFQTIMRVNTPGDAFFCVLEGQVRLRLMVQGKELLISVLEPGGVFGQISLFDSGRRLTDALSETPVVLFKVSAPAFKQFCQKHPAIATPILLGLGRTLATRIRTDDKHLCELISMKDATG